MSPFSIFKGQINKKLNTKKKRMIIIIRNVLPRVRELSVIFYNLQTVACPVFRSEFRRKVSALMFALSSFVYNQWRR